ncbi:MAG TPA: type II toxin-antitoxin system RelE/ParE family toxin [Tepidiformaceae bacterium]
MTYSLRFTNLAERYLGRCDRETRARIALKLRHLAEDPLNPAQSKLLTNMRGLRSARVGSIRILFMVLEEEEVLLVEDIGPRGQIYRRR